MAVLPWIAAILVNTAISASMSPSRPRKSGNVRHSPNHSQIYSPLDVRPKQIRLAILLPGSQSAPIVCCLVTVNLSKEGHFHTPVGSESHEIAYTALSYEWGDPRHEREIILQGKRFQIRENLWSGLLHLRTETQPLILWIDAICIDQRNPCERSHQVGFMKDIYEKAVRVRVWLGKEKKCTPKAFALLKKAAALSDPYTSDLARTSYYDDTKDRRFCRILDRYSLDVWDAVLDLLSRTYWKRIWVIQEFVLAREIIIHCGGSTMNANDLQKFLSLVPSSMYDHHIPIEEARFSRQINNSRGAQLSNQRYLHRTVGSNRTLMNLISRHEDCEATDCRDKIYALLGLAVDVGPGDIVVDYNKQLSEIWKDVVWFYTIAQPRRNRVATLDDTDSYTSVRYQR